MPVLSSHVVLVISDGESQYERVNSQSTIFSVRSERKVARDHNNSFVPVRNAGFQSLQEMSESCGLCGKMLVGRETGVFGLGPTATLTGAGSQAGNSLMATVSKIFSRKKRTMRNARKSAQEAAGLLLKQTRSCAGDAAKTVKEDEERQLVEETWSACIFVCLPDQQGRLRALRRERQSAVMTMTGGARKRHRVGAYVQPCAVDPTNGAVKSPPPSRPAATLASMEDLREQRQNLTKALHQRTNVLGSIPPIKFPPTRNRGR